jgi:hypothetical protein
LPIHVGLHPALFALMERGHCPPARPSGLPRPGYTTIVHEGTGPVGMIGPSLSDTG